MANQIQMLPLSSVKLWKDNPRKNDQSAIKLAGLLKVHGIRTPIVVWRKDMTIYKGNTTYKAAKIAGFKEIPVIIADFKTYQDAVTYALADNKASEWADWDDTSLEKLLTGKEMLGSDLHASTGFSFNELNFTDRPIISLEVETKPLIEVPLSYKQIALHKKVVKFLDDLGVSWHQRAVKKISMDLPKVLLSLFTPRKHIVQLLTNICIRNKKAIVSDLDYILEIQGFEKADGIYDGGLFCTTEDFIKTPENASDFPTVPMVSLTRISPEVLTVLSNYQFEDYVQKSRSRPSLQCVSVQKDQIVSTDGMRLLIYKLKSPCLNPFLLPYNLLLILKKLVKLVDFDNISISKEHLVVTGTGYRIFLKLPVGLEYPDINAVIPKVFAVKRQLTVTETMKIRDTLEKVQPFVDKTRRVVFSSDGLIQKEPGVKLFGSNSIGFNIDYLQDILGNFAAPIVYSNNPMDVVLFKENNLTCGIMPLRI